MVDMATISSWISPEKNPAVKCNYCRIGTKRMLEILERITNGEGRDGDIELLEELAVKIKDGSTVRSGTDCAQSCIDNSLSISETNTKTIFTRKNVQQNPARH